MNKEQRLKNDKREESTTNTGTDTETGGNSR